MFSIPDWLLADSALPFWAWVNHVLDALVALGVIGESYCHLIPDFWLQSRFRSAETKALAGKWSTVVLAVSILAVVPVGIIKETIADRIGKRTTTV